VTTGVVLAAAGVGSRLGSTAPKALVYLGGRPLVAHAIERVCQTGAVRQIVVTAPTGYTGAIEDAAREAIWAGVNLRVVEGARESRQASVAAGLAALGEADDIVLVHDAARPMTPPEMISRLIAAVRAGQDAVVPVLAVHDTIRAVDPASPGRALGTVDRDRLRAVQTPQAFRGEVLRRAHALGVERSANEARAASDDATLVEALGLPVGLVAGEPAAMKITSRHDLAVAELFLEEGW